LVKDNDYRLFGEIQDSFMGPQTNEAFVPKFYHPSAYAKEYTPGSSVFYNTDKESWSALSGAERMEIFSQRNIIIRGQMRDTTMPLDESTFAQLGVPVYRKLEMHGLYTPHSYPPH
jgi:hypothetical protein